MNAERPISTVLHDIAGNVQDIVRSELRLAKTELTDEMAKAGHAGMLVGAGALMLIFMALFVLLAIVYGLSLVMPAWAAAATVAVAVGLVAALCFAMGIKRFKTVRAAPKTVATLKENAEWTKQLIK
jgi:uncharacterized membrane protein YqjE